MRSLAILTTTAAMTLLGVANAQQAGAPDAAPQPATGDVASTSSAPLHDAVQAYAAYQADIGRLRSVSVANADQLESALDTSTRHNRDAISRGWIAYGAMTAAQSPAFNEGVREAAAYYGRDAVIRGMLIDTGWARMLRGGDEATRLVLESSTADAARIGAVANRFQELAYSLQRQRWANAVAPRQSERIQRVRANGIAPRHVAGADVGRLIARPMQYTPWTDPTAYGGRRFWDAIGGNSETVEVSAPASYTWRLKPERGEAVNRMTTIAALQALGAAEERPQDVDRLLNEQRSRDCVEMAQLQLYQCMSAARFRYENAFCLGSHALAQVGQCINDVAAPGPAPGAQPLSDAAGAARPGTAEAALAAIQR
ncbi:MAG: hypothetical protein HXY28_01995 [Hydrogenophilaceae bacterium]|jgi:hypothetical protein|nr:hypothetical protein [Hydrogenophilaceae bacterium]